MAGSTESKGFKKFTCPKCGCNHIIDSNLDIQHSYYTESQSKDKEVQKQSGVEDPEKNDGESSSGESQSKATKEEETKTEFEEEVQESEEVDEEEDEWNSWGNW